MTRRTWLIVGGLVALILGVVAIITLSIERLVTPRRAEMPAPAPAPPAATAHITATLFYGSLDGQALVPIRREVPLAATPVAQGTEILTAQLSAAAPPLVSVIPRGTRLRAFYITESGDAFVDLSREVTAGHAGGSLYELFTVYAIVNAVTANLPKVQRVQLLVDGKEVDTLAGHVDVRRPLLRDRSLVRER